jgi:hypothetical protein
MKLGKLIGVLLAVLVLIPVGASAQSQFAGNVQDDTGGALPGVTVTAASEALIEGSRLAVTDGTGQYQIIVKVGFEHSWAWHINTRSTNANLFQVYGDDPNPFGITTSIVDADSPFAATNLAAGTAPGLTGDPRSVTVYNDPSISRVDIDYDSGIYAQDSWTIDRLTINYGGRIDFAKSSVTAEWRRRWFRNSEFNDNTLRSFSDFGDPIQVVAPLPYVGTIPIYNIDPAIRSLIDEVDANFEGDGYKEPLHRLRAELPGAD